VTAAVGITALHVVLGCALTGAPSLSGAYDGLCKWDSAWYAGIATKGYIGPPVPTLKRLGNVAFFPGYPGCTWLVKKATGLPVRVALLVTAQGACVGFWTYLLLFFQRWGVPLRAAVAAVLIVASYPGAFFLVVGYSESLFLMATLGFFYWAGSGSRAGLALAALHGFVMTSTRLVGAPLVVVPLLQVLLDLDASQTLWQRCRRLLPPAVLTVAAVSGIVLFFGYCQVHFGRWDLYLLTNKVGWAVAADKMAFFRSKTYWVPLPWNCWEDGYLAPKWFDHLTVPGFLAALAVLGGLEWRPMRQGLDTGWRWRAGLYAAAVSLFLLNVTGKGSSDLNGMIRFSHPLVVLLVMAAAHYVSRVGLPLGRARVGLMALFVPWVAFAFVSQLVLFWRFTHQLWVA
jgi:hypothetical protein